MVILYSQHVVAFHSYKIKNIKKTHDNSTRIKTSTDEQGVAVCDYLLLVSFYVVMKQSISKFKWTKKETSWSKKKTEPYHK